MRSKTGKAGATLAAGLARDGLAVEGAEVGETANDLRLQVDFVRDFDVVDVGQFQRLELRHRPNVRQVFRRELLPSVVVD